jgi:D-alanine-D-alanine ligase
MKLSSQPSSALPCRDMAAHRVTRIAIVYNQPVPCSYEGIGEDKAVISVLEGVVAAHRALDELGYQVTIVPLLPPVEHAKDILESLDADLVFNLFEGFDTRPKTEATIAGIMSELGFTYTGCSPAALALGLDKAKVKDLLRAHGINTPKYQLLTPETVSRFELSFPCIVKPSGQDASHGLTADSVVNDRESLERQVAGVSRAFGGKALVEEFVDGREFNATVMGNDDVAVLPISEIVYSLPPGMPRVLTYAAKWEEDTPYYNGTRVACPAEVGVEESAMLIQTAVAVFRVVAKHGYARVDMRVDPEGRVQVLECNPNPDITPGSGAARQAAAASMTYPQFIDKLVSMALHKTRA